MAEYFTKDGDNFVKVNDSLLTQEGVDAIVEKRLDRERSKYSDYETVKATADKATKELEETKKTLTATQSDWEGKLKKANLETEKVKIIHEFKLPDDLAEFVDGESPEDMRKRAEKLSKGTGGFKLDIDKKEKDGKKPSGNKEIVGKLFGTKSDD